MFSERELTEAEHRLSKTDNSLVDLRQGQADRGDPPGVSGRDKERVVRASFLRELITASGHGAGVPHRHAVRLRGARITGTLSLEGEDLPCPVLLQDCRFDDPVNVCQARAASISLSGCHLPALEARQLEIRGNLLLEDGLAAASIDLRGAQVNGVLSLDGAILNNANGTTLHGEALTVGQGMKCGSGFTSEGTINLVEARISHGLTFTGATLRSTTGWALNARGMSISSALFLGSSYGNPAGFCADGGLRLAGVHVEGFVSFWDAHIKARNDIGLAIAALGLTVTENLMMDRGFTADGVVHLTNAKIGQEINLNGATLTSPQGLALDAQRLIVGDSLLCTDGFTAHGAINLAGSRISGSLDFTGAVLNKPEANTLDLRGMTAGTLIARPSAQAAQVDLRHASVVVLDDDPPTWPAQVFLRDFSYQRIEHNPQVSAAMRLRWIERDPEGYLPQPYEQLIAAYQRAGQEEAARKAAIAKQQRRRHVLNPAAKAWSWLLYLTIGHGYRTWQAGLWLLGLMLFGTAVFAHTYPAGMTATRQPAMPFNAPIYTLDVLLPIIDLGQQDSWQPAGATQYVYWALIILGWVLTSALVAGLTGVFRRD